MIRLTPPTRRRFVSSGWGQSREYRGGWHAGLDFPDSAGSPVLAAAPGVVTTATKSSGFAGNYIAIDHGDGVTTRYLHNTANLVKPGDRVARGQQIGTVGSTGTVTGVNHVHFDVKFKPDALAQYKRLFGEPTTGFSEPMSWGRGAPAEALMSEADYKPSVIEASRARGVSFYRPSATILPIALAAAVGYGLYRLLA